MKEAIREMFLTDWVKEATTNEIVEKLIEHDERGKEIERLNNIIKEVREYIEEKHYYSEVINEEYLLKSELLEILDKGE